MTTPEKQRRREFLFIGLVGLVMATFLGLSVWDSRNEAQAEKDAKGRDDRQNAQFQKCITETVGDLVNALDARNDLTSRDAASVTRLIADLLKAGDDEVRAERAVETYMGTQEEIAKTRAENPFPPFPDGKCEFTTKGRA